MRDVMSSASLYCWLRRKDVVYVYLLVTVVSCGQLIRQSDLLEMASSKLISVDFEVFGRVQGVFFRKYTAKQSKELGLRGWCMNTPKGTVQGKIEGEPDKIEKMKSWLQKTGSPKSKIEKVDFKNERAVSEYSFKDFAVRC